MAKEKNLTAVTSVAAADFARVVTSAGASVKATFANVAKYIVETYNGSTVAGSAQSVKSALDSLNSNTTVSETTVTGTTNQFGAINLNLPWRNYEIIAIASSNGNHWCIPTIVGASTYARVLIDGASWTPAGNVSVSLTVRYRHYSQ